jgi:hypothetical protein
MAGWRKLPADRSKHVATMKRDALDLIRWCSEHHKGIPVKRFYSTQWCNDEKNHPEMWRKMENLKRRTKSAQAWQYKEAFTLLDKAFPGQWRPGDGGG